MKTCTIFAMAAGMLLITSTTTARPLYVTAQIDGDVLHYDGKTGQFVGILVNTTDPMIGIAASPDNSLFYAGGSGRLRRFNQDGTPNNPGPNFPIEPGIVTVAVAVDAGGNIHQGTTGHDHTLRHTPAGVASPGSGESGSDFSDSIIRPRYVTIGPDGNLYAGQTDNSPPPNNIYKLDISTGSILSTFASYPSGREAGHLTFGPSFDAGGTPDLYAVSLGSASTTVISIFDGVTGASIGTIVNGDLPGIPGGIGFSPDDPNRLLVVSANGGGNKRFDIPGNGTYADLGTFLTGGPSGSPPANLQAFIFIPEPASASALGLIALGLLGRRTRN